jgi:hypothetical protein
MRNFVNLEEAKRLKAAGFPQGNTEFIYALECLLGKEMFLKRTSLRGYENNIDAPSAAELMSEMNRGRNGKEHLMPVLNDYLKTGDENTDIIPALVEAFCKSKGAI